MLIGISPLISPDLLRILSMMGHGDEIVLADAHFPSESLGPPCLRADGLMITDLLSAILPLFALDDYVDNPISMMSPVVGDKVNPNVEDNYLNINQAPSTKEIVINKINGYLFEKKNTRDLITKIKLFLSDNHDTKKF